MRRILLAVTVFFSISAHAKWIEHAVVRDVESTDPKEIAGLLTMFPDTLNYLSADNLTAPSRLKIKRFEGRLSYYLWENDEDCAVKDPSLVAYQRVYQTQTEFFYVDKPDEVFTFENFNAPPTPCHAGEQKVVINKQMKARK